MTWSRLPWLLAILQVATLAAAQSPPGYDGTWTKIQPALSADSSHLEEVELRGNALRIRVEQRGSGGRLAYGFSDDRTYTIDGPVESKRDDEGRIRTVGVHWEGPNIVFVRTTVEGANTTIEREVWLVSDGGRTFTKERQTMDWRGVRTERVVFARTEQKLRR